MEDDLMVHEMHYDKDGLNLKLGGQTAMVFLSTLVDLFKVNGGENFLTMTVHRDEIKYAITIQNCNGEDSPAEKLERYERALKTIQSESNDILAKGVCTRALENSQTENS